MAVDIAIVLSSIQFPSVTIVWYIQYISPAKNDTARMKEILRLVILFIILRWFIYFDFISLKAASSASVISFSFSEKATLPKE